MSPIEEPLSHQLLVSSEREFNMALAMPFVRDVIAGTVESRVFATYLVFEADFVVTAIRARGHAIALAPTMTAITGHCEAMRSLLEGQRPALEGYKSGVTPEVIIPAAAHDRARKLTSTMMALLAEGTYAQVICALYACEHLYRVWCKEALSGGIAKASRELEDDRGNFLAVAFDWVRAHTEEPFTSEVQFLEQEIDRLEVASDDVQALSRTVQSMLVAEIEFHAAAYMSCW